MREIQEGDVFGLLKTLLKASSKNGKTRWQCLCACGTITIVYSENLKRDRTKSCGCNRDIAASLSLTKHGMHGTRTYQSWRGMRQRCNNPVNPRYKDYGGRGIKVCDRWSSFENFFFDMGTCPDDLEIERRDNNGNYEPGNCYWATKKQQANNRRSSKIIEFQGESLTMKLWAEKTGIPYYTLNMRLRRGMTIEKALTQPVKKCRHHSGASSYPKA